MSAPVDAQESPLPVARRGFTLGPPDGFIELPLDDDELASPEHFEPLVAKVAATFGLAPHDENARAAASALAIIGTVSGVGGVDYSAVAFYKSPDDPLRPVMIVLTCVAMPSDHDQPAQAVSNLVELHADSSELTLPVGPAAAIVTEERNALAIDEETIPILTRQVSAWVPDRDGTTIGVVSLMTNCFQDWEHVCELALDVFETFEWEPLDK